MNTFVDISNDLGRLGPPDPTRARQRGVPKRYKHSKPFTQDLNIRASGAYGPHKTHSTIVLETEIYLVTRVVLGGDDLRARPHGACSARHKRSKPCSESKGSETGGTN